jgi:hypothetical protein
VHRRTHLHLLLETPKDSAFTTSRCNHLLKLFTWKCVPLSNERPVYQPKALRPSLGGQPVGRAPPPRKGRSGGLQEQAGRAGTTRSVQSCTHEAQAPAAMWRWVPIYLVRRPLSRVDHQVSAGARVRSSPAPTARQWPWLGVLLPVRGRWLIQGVPTRIPPMNACSRRCEMRALHTMPLQPLARPRSPVPSPAAVNAMHGRATETRTRG